MRRGSVSVLAGLLMIIGALCSDSTEATSLTPGGTNVLTKYQSQLVYVQQSYQQRASRRQCRQTCDCWFCLCTKTVCWTSYYYQQAYRAVATYRARAVYVCAPGWRQQGSECTVAICSTITCANGGTCSRPNVCSCTTAWTGQNCTTNVNECATNNGGCDHRCNDTVGSFNCSCFQGYRLTSKTRCEDIDECSVSRNTTGCQQLCVNQPGTYYCACHSGFTMNNNNKTCTDINECLINNGTTHACEYRCNNTAGSYKCSCQPGYLLTTDQRNCADHDECATGNNTCEQLCINHPGHYTCDCRRGYQLNSRDNNTCLDVNECARNTDGCAHVCNNTVGAYQCSCRHGYYLVANNKSCYDVNECSRPDSGGCSQQCVNVIGSYYCSCRHGYYLDFDLKTCKKYPCLAISAPSHGLMDCTGRRTDDVCRFTCETGYELLGSRTRVCLSNARWSGTPTECAQKQCADLQPPKNGFIQIPCGTSYGANCNIGCNPGYLINGTSSVTCSHNEAWQPSKAYCEGAGVCAANPCQHGGGCLPVNSTHFQCNCTGTGYSGEFCTQGHVISPDIPILQIGSTVSLAFRLSTPDQPITIAAQSRGVTFHPGSLSITADAGNHRPYMEFDWNVTAIASGSYVISYVISGPGRNSYDSVPPSLVTVRRNNSSCLTNQSSSSATGCYAIKLAHCAGSARDLVLMSTADWQETGTGVSSDGVVTLVTWSLDFPLSLKGISLPAGSYIPKSQTSSCDHRHPNANNNCIPKYGLARLFLDSINGDLPTWLNIIPGLATQDVSFSDVMSYIWTGKQLRSVLMPSNVVIIEDGVYSVLLITNAVTLQVNDDSAHSPTRPRSAPIVMAVKLCEGPRPDVLLHFDAGSTRALQTLGFHKRLASLGWDVSVSSIQWSPAHSLSRNTVGSWFWDGVRMTQRTPLTGHIEVSGRFSSSLNDTGRFQLNGSALFNTSSVTQQWFASPDKILPSPWRASLQGAMSISLNDVITLGRPLTLQFDQSEGYAVHTDGASSNANCTRQSKTILYVSGTVQGSTLVSGIMSAFVAPRVTERVLFYVETELIETITETSVNCTPSGYANISVYCNETSAQTNTTVNCTLSTICYNETNAQTNTTRTVNCTLSGNTNISAHCNTTNTQTNASVNCTLSTICYNETNAQTNTTVPVSSVNCTLLGIANRTVCRNTTKPQTDTTRRVTRAGVRMNTTARYGPLLFPSADIQLKITTPYATGCVSNSNNDVTVESTFTREERLGIFFTCKPSLAHRLKLTRISSEEESYNGVLYTEGHLLGATVPLTVYLSNSSLQFTTKLDVFNLFPAEVNASAPLGDWELMALKISGVLSKAKVANEQRSFPRELEQAVNNYISVVAFEAEKRVNSSAKAQNMSEYRINITYAKLVKAESSLQASNEMYLSAVSGLWEATQQFTQAQKVLYENRSAEFVTEVTSLLGLCNVVDCPFACVAGTLCSMCSHNITSRTRGLCPATCNRTVHERVSPKGQWTKCRGVRCQNATVVRGPDSKMSNIECNFKQAFSGIGQETKTRPMKRRSPFDFPPFFTSQLANKIKTDDDSSIRYKLPSGAESVNSKATCRYQSASRYSCEHSSYDCYKDMYNYSYKHVSYACEVTCDTKIQTETIATPCCVASPCASRTKDIACRKQNVFCRTLRNRVMDKMPKSKQELLAPFKVLQELQSKVFAAEMDVEVRKINLQSATSSRDTLQRSAHSLMEAYTLSQQSHSNNLALLRNALTMARKLRTNKKPLVEISNVIFHFHLNDANMTKIPIRINAGANSQVKFFDITIDSNNLEGSYQKAAELVTFGFYSDVSAAIRPGYPLLVTQNTKRAAADLGNTDEAKLMQFHRKCSLSVNYKRGLTDVLQSLLELTEQTLQLLKNATAKTNANSNANFTFDRNGADKLGVSSQDIEAAKQSIVSDAEILKALAILQLVNTSTAQSLQEVASVVFKDWASVMEKLFHHPAMECSGFIDCMNHVTDSMFYLYDNVALPQAADLKSHIADVRVNFVSLLDALDLTATRANDKSRSILDILKLINDVQTYCAKAPVITTQPQALTEATVGTTLTLTCVAMATPSSAYRWAKDGVSLPGRIQNILTITELKARDSGNYTCIAYNHVTSAKSAMGHVIVHTPPVITRQPPSHVTVPTQGDRSIIIAAVSTDNPLSYQWYFKSTNNGVYSTLNNEIYPVLTIQEAQQKHQGFYRCQISNRYGNVWSRETRVFVLDFALPRPSMLMKTKIQQETVTQRRSKISRRGLGEYHGVFENPRETLKLHLEAFLGDLICPMITLPSDCVTNTNVTECYHGDANVTVCGVTFQLRSINVSTDGVTNEIAEHNAVSVEDAANQLWNAVNTLLNVTQGPSLSVAVGPDRFTIPKGNTSADQYVGACPDGKMLNSAGFLCVSCAPGTFLTVSGVASKCEPCPVATYQPSQGQSSCLPCPTRYSGQAVGLVDKASCPGSRPTTTPPPVTIIPTTPRTSSYTNTTARPVTSDEPVPSTPDHHGNGTILRQKADKGGKITWIIAVAVSAGIVAIVIIVCFVRFCKKRQTSQPSPLPWRRWKRSSQKSEYDNDEPASMFDNPVFLPGEPDEVGPGESLEMEGRDKMCHVSDSMYDEDNNAPESHANPLYMAFAGDSEA